MSTLNTFPDEEKKEPIPGFDDRFESDEEGTTFTALIAEGKRYYKQVESVAHH